MNIENVLLWLEYRRGLSAQRVSRVSEVPIPIFERTPCAHDVWETVIKLCIVIKLDEKTIFTGRPSCCGIVNNALFHSSPHINQIRCCFKSFTTCTFWLINYVPKFVVNCSEVMAGGHESGVLGRFTQLLLVAARRRSPCMIHRDLHNMYRGQRADCLDIQLNSEFVASHTFLTLCALWPAIAVASVKVSCFSQLTNVCVSPSFVQSSFTFTRKFSR